MNRLVSVAPMMDCTDRHERYFLRLISKNTLLYTEMIVDEAINRGDKKKLLEFNINEKPVALQLGGSSPKLLAEAAKVGEDFGYDEINLNLGCPSKKVEKNKFGACLMKEPNLVADCLSKMQSVTKLPVTIKTRIGYDNVEDYENFYKFIETLKKHPRIVNKKAKIALVANKGRDFTNIYWELDDFLSKQKIPFLTMIRDSQNYIKAASRGVGIFEMGPAMTDIDRELWEPVIKWLKSKRSMP